MNIKRYVTLEPAEAVTLQEGYKNSKDFQFRARCHCLLLSNQRYEIASLATIFQVGRQTITNWFDGWRDKGIRGIMTQPGQGRKPILTPVDQPLIKARVQAAPQNMKQVREELKQELNKEFSTKTLTRFLKSLVKPVGVAGVKA